MDCILSQVWRIVRTKSLDILGCVETLEKMSMMESTEDFKEILNKIPYLSIVEEEDKFILNYERFDKSWKLKKSVVESLLKKLKEKNIEDETILYDEYSYEVLIKFEMTRPIPIRIFYDEERILKEDVTNGIKYELSNPTDEYMLFVLKLLGDSEDSGDLFRPLSSHIMRERISKEKLDFFEFLSKIMIPRIYTLKIKSHEPMSISQFSKLAMAFLFNLSYNLDITVIEIRFLHEFSHYRFGRIRRSRPDEIEPPRRTYIPDLVYHYQMAISTDSIPIQFLSFYHVIEYFFYDIYHEELLNVIRAKITSPDFSYKRKRDLETLVKLISQKIKHKDDEVSYNEQEALYLTLKKYVDLDNLMSRLRDYNESLIEYYKENKVSFSQGNHIEFSLSNTEKIFRQIADRIYKTRNSIVHSKESGKPRYMPFRDDRKLLLEIPLLRFIAEEIIINTAEVIQ